MIGTDIKHIMNRDRIAFITNSLYCFIFIKFTLT